VNAVVDAAPLSACPHCGQTHPAQMLRCPETDIILPLAGRMLDGRFRFLELIGRGGMASVWLARNERVDRLVAIKLVRPEVARDDDLVARFRAEARAAGRIGHPNICDILDSGRSPIGPYIVMEYLRGRSLGELLAECGRLPTETAVMLVREALRGLVAAHKAGIVHRDLKPENLFLHRPETGEPTVKIMDFGVAKFIDGTGEVRTQHGALLGTPEYMAPEQFRGAAHAEPRTDIWAVGAILYRAITGQNAFGGPTVAATLLMVSSDHPTPIDELVSDVPKALVEIVARCLQKQPSARFADVAELDAALAPFDAGEPDTTPWELPASEAGTSDERVQGGAAGEPSAPTNPWSSPPLRRAPERERRSRWWIAAVALVAGAGAFAWLRGWAIDALEQRPETAEARDDDARDEPDESAPAGAASTGEQEIETPEPAPRVSIVPSTEPTPPFVPAPSVAPTDTGDDTEAMPATPTIPPPPDIEPTEDTAPGTTGTPEIDPIPGTTPGPPPVDPVGVFRVGKYVFTEKTLAVATHNQARRYCDALRATQYLGIRGWSLPNPSQSKKLVGQPSAKKSKYWTSARYRGKALVIALPSGTTASVSAERARARGICIAKWP
jgi:serine/threonine-protein kinase